MATTYLHPGVYIEEKPGARPIEGVSTDVACFVGYTQAGEVNTPTLVTSWNEYLEKFGGLIWGRMVPWAVYNFFNNLGASCYVVNSGYASGAESGKVEFDINLTSGAGTTDPAATGKLTVTATSIGAWSDDLRIGIVTQPPGDVEKEKPVSFDLLVLAPQTPVSETATAPTGASTYLINQYIDANEALKMTVTVDDGNGTETEETLYVLESFTGFTGSDLVGATNNLMNRVNGTSVFVTVSGSAAGTNAGKLIPSPGFVQMSGGSGTGSPFDPSFQALNPIEDFSTIALADSVMAATYLMVKDEEENETMVVGAKDQKAEVNALLGPYLETWKHAFMSIDPPFGYTYQTIQGYKEGSDPDNNGEPLNSTYGALYYPWIEFRNPFNSKKVWLPPSGAALGKYAATDNSVGVWKAPAGVTDGLLLTAIGLETEVTETQQNFLNPKGIDAIRSILSYGICLYGARTVSLDPEWRYINVRRLAIFVETSLYNALQWAVFEPNGPNTWARINRDVTAFLTGIWRAGGLFGNSAAEAFFVVCNASNNPPEERDLGRLHVDVGIAPIKPAEFVIIRISQIVQTS